MGHYSFLLFFVFIQFSNRVLLLESSLDCGYSGEADHLVGSMSHSRRRGVAIERAAPTERSHPLRPQR